MSKYLSDENLHVLTNVISGVESYDQKYSDERRWNAWADAYENTSNENSITIGWHQAFREEARDLLQRIFNADESLFKKLDTAGIEGDIKHSFAYYMPRRGSAKYKAIIALITSSVGKRCQDEQFQDGAETYMSAAIAFGVPKTNPKALMFWVEIQHLGGLSAARRIFNRCGANPTTDQIMKALEKDQYDTSSSNQVGDKIFWSRHECCKAWIDKYTVLNGKEVIPTATALSRAKTLLRMPQRDTMTGYTPDGKRNFVDAGAWYKTPKKGDVIYFYSTTKGRVGHVGIVEKVYVTEKRVDTIEGNTSSTEYAENGGCVARHSYSYAAQGGTNRVNGFGRPNFKAAGVTASDFVATAASYLGYLEKASNKDLDSKKGNAGYNNFQRFQRDVGAGNGDQWCQYFVDAMALYTCKGTSGQTETKLNEKAKWSGYVTTDELNVRMWAGTDNDLCSFSPLKFGEEVGVCDEIKAPNGDPWYYILYGKKHGFVSAKYISKEKPAPKKYTVQIGVFKLNGNAVKYAEKVNKLTKFATGVKKNADGTFKATCGVFKTKANAENRVKKLAKYKVEALIIES